MFDIGGVELLVIMAVAILVVGPKELPALMRGVGRFVSKAQAMAREFYRSFEEMARETELEKARQEINDLTKDAQTAIGEQNLTGFGKDSAAHPTGEQASHEPGQTPENVMEKKETAP
jgi:Tat protein translocase TatB subunit